MVLTQKIEILIVGLKCTQDSELCFMVRRQVKSGEEEAMSIWFGDVSSDVSGEVSGDYRPPHRDGHSSLRSSGAPELPALARSWSRSPCLQIDIFTVKTFHRAWWISEQSQISSLNSLLFELTLRFDAENSSHHGHQFL